MKLSLLPWNSYHLSLHYYSATSAYLMCMKPSWNSIETGLKETISLYLQCCTRSNGTWTTNRAWYLLQFCSGELRVMMIGSSSTGKCAVSPTGRPLWSIVMFNLHVIVMFEQCACASIWKCILWPCLVPNFFWFWNCSTFVFIW